MVPALLDLYSADRTFYPNREKSERMDMYALGVVMFRCLFGFYPFEQRWTDTFNFKTYLDLLNDKTVEGCQQIYYFLKVKTKLS